MTCVTARYRNYAVAKILELVRYPQESGHSCNKKAPRTVPCWDAEVESGFAVLLAAGADGVAVALVAHSGLPYQHQHKDPKVLCLRFYFLQKP